jgi:hypothetical protein
VDRNEAGLRILEVCMKKLNEKGSNTVEFTVLAIACFVMLNILLRFTPFGAILAQRVDDHGYQD